MTRDEMAEAWGIHPSMISQVTRDIVPVDFLGYGKRRKGLYRPQEVAEVFAEDAREKRRRAQESVINYGDRLRRLAPYLEGPEGGA